MSNSVKKFIKSNPLPGSRSLHCEAEGLELIRSGFNQHGLRTPEIFEITDEYLTMERVETRSGSTEQYSRLGLGLARMHKITNENFGFGQDNFIGLNPQINTWHSDWGEFFFEYRLQQQASWIKDSELRNFIENFLTGRKAKLTGTLNAHSPAPSLLHGDLWNGNVLFTATEVFLIDPAIYYGDRETDLAMTKLFGGFPEEFYSSYASEYPLPPDFERRFEIYNLYHLLNHLNLFGGGYRSQVVTSLKSIDRWLSNSSKIQRFMG